MQGLGAGVRWAEFATQAESLAAEIARLVEQYRFAFVGTIRRDGTPRISPVETHLVHEDLMLAMIPRTRKAADIRRDDRVTLQSPIGNAGNPGAEYKLRGRALFVKDADAREAAADAVEVHSGWRPGPSWLVVAVAVFHAVHTLWNEDGTATMTRWAAGGVPDPASGAGHGVRRLSNELTRWRSVGYLRKCLISSSSSWSE